MADQDTGLPIRSEADGSDERVQVKIVDSANPDSQQATVDTDKNVKVAVYGDKADDASDVALLLSEEGRPNGRGDYQVDDNSKPASAGLVAHTRDAAKDDTHLVKRVSAIDSAEDTDVTALDVAIRDYKGDRIDQDNPLPVFQTEAPGDEVLDYNEADSIAKAASSNHDYTVSGGKILILDAVWASASGKMKIELQVETGVASGIFNTKVVGFNSTANPNVDWPAYKRVKVEAGVIVRLIKTNLDNLPQDLSSTYIGVEN